MIFGKSLIDEITKYFYVKTKYDFYHRFRLWLSRVISEQLLLGWEWGGLLPISSELLLDKKVDAFISSLEAQLIAARLDQVGRAAI